MQEHRLDRAAYFAAVFEILEREGSDGVTVAALCEQLRVTKGSFYHHFADMGGLIQAFVDQWEREIRERISGYDSLADRCARVQAAINTTAALSHEAEAALRAWGATQPVIRAAQDRIDAYGEATLVKAVAEFIQDPELAALVAYSGVSLAVGMQHRQRPIDRSRYLEVLAHWARVQLGVKTDVVVTSRGREVRVTEADL